MVRVTDLLPGHVVTLGGDSAVFIAAPPHPLHRGLRLVLWKMPDGTWSLDALLAEQEVGDLLPGQSPPARWARVQEAFGET